MAALEKARREKADERDRREAAEAARREKEAAVWPEPIPLDTPNEAAPPYPLDVLPASMRDLCESVAEAVNCPVDYPATCLVTYAAGAIGAHAVVEIKETYYERSSLFSGLVGGSSARKSPPMKILGVPLMAEQSRRIEAVKDLKTEDLPAEYGHGEGEILVSDVTAEGLGDLLMRQPRGLTLTMEELVGWVLGHNAYKPNGRGADRQFFLQVWDSASIMVNRSGGRKVWVSKPTLSVLGGIQPDVLKSFLSVRDGFAERILFSFPESRPARGENWKVVPAALRKRWAEALGRLWDLQMYQPRDGGRPEPHVLKLDADARVEWEKHTNELADLRNDPEFPEHLQSVYGKLDGYGARLALVLQFLDDATDGTNGQRIRGKWMAAGSRLSFYHGAHARKVHASGGRDERLDGARKIANWAAKKGRPTFSRADVYADLRRSFGRPEALVEPLRLLREHHVVRYLQQDVRPGPGRRPTPIFELHPAALAGKIRGLDAPPGPAPGESGGDGPPDGEPQYEYE